MNKTLYRLWALVLSFGKSPAVKAAAPAFKLVERKARRVKGGVVGERLCAWLSIHLSLRWGFMLGVDDISDIYSLFSFYCVCLSRKSGLKTPPTKSLSKAYIPILSWYHGKVVRFLDEHQKIL